MHHSSVAGYFAEKSTPSAAHAVRLINVLDDAYTAPTTMLIASFNPGPAAAKKNCDLEAELSDYEIRPSCSNFARCSAC